MAYPYSLWEDETNPISLLVDPAMAEINKRNRMREMMSLYNQPGGVSTDDFGNVLTDTDMFGMNAYQRNAYTQAQKNKVLENQLGGITQNQIPADVNITPDEIDKLKKINAANRIEGTGMKELSPVEKSIMLAKEGRKFDDKYNIFQDRFSKTAPTTSPTNAGYSEATSYGDADEYVQNARPLTQAPAEAKGLFGSGIKFRPENMGYAAEKLIEYGTPLKYRKEGKSDRELAMLDAKTAAAAGKTRMTNFYKNVNASEISPTVLTKLFTPESGGFFGMSETEADATAAARVSAYISKRGEMIAQGLNPTHKQVMDALKPKKEEEK